MAANINTLAQVSTVVGFVMFAPLAVVLMVGAMFAVAEAVRYARG